MRRHLAAVALLAAAAASASPSEVAALLQDYWGAYARSDFAAAATRLDPRDLEGLRSGVLPLFLQASESRNVNVVPLVQAFFRGVPPDAREDMTGPQVFAGMNRMMRDVMPGAYAALAQTRIRVGKVTMADDGTATVEYTVLMPDAEAADVERANRHEGRWYLRTKDSPDAAVERFRMLLGLDYETGPEVKLSPPESV